jgi:hypothetical protein
VAVAVYRLVTASGSFQVTRFRFVVFRFLHLPKSSDSFVFMAFSTVVELAYLDNCILDAAGVERLVSKVMSVAMPAVRGLGAGSGSFGFVCGSDGSNRAPPGCGSVWAPFGLLFGCLVVICCC